MGHRTAVSSRASSENQCWFLQSGSTNRTVLLLKVVVRVMEEKHERVVWANRGPTHPCPLKNKFGSEFCLLKRKGQPLACLDVGQGIRVPAAAGAVGC